MLLLLFFFFCQCTAKVEVRHRFAKRMWAKTIWWPFINFLCVCLHKVIQLRSCRRPRHWHHPLPIAFVSLIFNYFYTALIYANEISTLTLWTKTFILQCFLYLCTIQFLFLIHSSVLCDIWGVAVSQPHSQPCPRLQIHLHQYLCVRKAQLRLFRSASGACAIYWAVLFTTWRAPDRFAWSALIQRYKLDSPRAFEQCHGYIHLPNLVCG